MITTFQSHAYKNGVISQDHAVEEISGNQEGQEEMVVSVSNKTDDENVVDDSIHKANNRIRGNADQNGNVNERDEKITWMKASMQETWS